MVTLCQITIWHIKEYIYSPNTYIHICLYMCAWYITCICDINTYNHIYISLQEWLHLRAQSCLFGSVHSLVLLLHWLHSLITDDFLLAAGEEAWLQTTPCLYHSSQWTQERERDILSSCIHISGTKMVFSRSWLTGPRNRVEVYQSTKRRGDAVTWRNE